MSIPGYPFKMADLSATEEIWRVSFGPLGLNRTAVNVHIPETFDPDTRAPKKDGLKDTRLGAQGQLLCSTCQENTCNCGGHYGRFELCEWVPRTLVLSHTLALLRSICFNCSFILEKGVKENKKCRDCGLVQPKYRLSKASDESYGQGAPFIKAIDSNKNGASDKQLPARLRGPDIYTILKLIKQKIARHWAMESLRVGCSLDWRTSS